MIAAGIALAAYLQARAHPYYPIAQVAAPEGLSYTAFSEQAGGREACVAANQLFIRYLQKDCPSCTVTFSRCEEKEQAVKLLLETQARQHVVHSPAMQIAVGGPEGIAKTSCEHIAAELIKQGMQGGRCSVPRKS